jgi:hypothetical protein
VDAKVVGAEAGKSTSTSRLVDLRYRTPSSDEFIDVPLR